MIRRYLPAVLIVAALMQPSMAGATSALGTTDAEACLIESITAEREARGLPRLRFDALLVDDARAHSRAMARRQELYHSSPAGMDALLPSGWTGWGENVGVGGNCRQLHRAFMDSPDHRSILLSDAFNNVAVGAVVGADGSLWVTETFFGHPSTAPGVGPFWDDDDSIHQADIRALAEAGVTSGCGYGRYCPDQPLSRGEMAAFLARALGLPPASTDYFSDDEGSVFEANINALAAAGITSGCGSGRFCAEDPVTRGQMAAFLSRAFNLAPSLIDRFSDDETSPFEPEINALASAGITAGCGAGAFCADARLTRAEMASFLIRALSP